MRKPDIYLGRPVASLQTMLRLISDHEPHVLPVVPDSFYGPSTYASVRSLQEISGLPITGNADLQTWNTMVSLWETALSQQTPPESVCAWSFSQTVLPGEENDNLYPVQAMLMALSKYYPELTAPPVHGIFDKETQTGLQWLQDRSDLPVTGQPDARTLQTLTDLFRSTVATDK